MPKSREVRREGFDGFDMLVNSTLFERERKSLVVVSDRGCRALVECTIMAIHLTRTIDEAILDYGDTRGRKGGIQYQNCLCRTKFLNRAYARKNSPKTSDC